MTLATAPASTASVSTGSAPTRFAPSRAEGLGTVLDLSLIHI